MMKKICGILIGAMIAVISLTGCANSTKAAVGKDVPDYMILVNKNHKIPESFVDTIELCDIENVSGGTYPVEKTTKQAFQDLQKDLTEQGVTIGVDSAYRSVEYQQELMDQFIAEYGEDYARRVVAEPGTSEHHTGLVIDLVPKINGEWVIENEDMLKEAAVFETIHRALPEHGFILRYPEGKESITGYDYEPWHIRYVGKEAAKEIMTRGITLEEYLGEK